MTQKRKIKGIEKVVSDTYNKMYNPEFIVKEMMHTNNNRRFRDSKSRDE